MASLLGHLALISTVGIGVAVARRLISEVFGDPALARRELTGFPPRRAIDVQEGPGQVTGRVMAAGSLLTAPLSGRECVFYQLQMKSWGRARDGSSVPPYRHPPRPVEFLLDDGTGRALVRVPPPPPEPIPGDWLPWEVVCSIAGEPLSRKVRDQELKNIDQFRPRTPARWWEGGGKVIERIISIGDVVAVGGFGSSEVVPDGFRDGHRSAPTRLLLTATGDYRLVIVKP